MRAAVIGSLVFLSQVLAAHAADLICPDQISLTPLSVEGWNPIAFDAAFAKAEFLVGEKKLVCYYAPRDNPQKMYTRAAPGTACPNAKPGSRPPIAVGMILDSSTSPANLARNLVHMHFEYQNTVIARNTVECYYHDAPVLGFWSKDFYSSCKINGKRATCAK